MLPGPGGVSEEAAGLWEGDVWFAKLSHVRQAMQLVIRSVVRWSSKSSPCSPSVPALGFVSCVDRKKYRDTSILHHGGGGGCP